MAIRDKMRANASRSSSREKLSRPCLGPRRQVNGSPDLWWIIVIRNSFRVVVVTTADTRVPSGRFRMTPVKELRHELPRRTRIGPAKGLWFKCESLGERLYIHKRFHKDVEAADALLPAEANHLSRRRLCLIGRSGSNRGIADGGLIAASGQ